MAKIIIPLTTNNHFWFKKPKGRGLIIDDIIRILKYINKNYKHVGNPKPEFTRYEFAKIVLWILYKTKGNFFDHEHVSRTFKQRAFWKYYYTCFLNGSGAQAARMAGYRNPKQRAWELIHDYRRKKY